jgi:hypothetical protein
MKFRYSEPMNITEARSWLKDNFGNDTRIPWGSRCLWVAGVQYVTDQPGVYLVGAAGGMCGVQVISPTVAQNSRAA